MHIGEGFDDARLDTLFLALPFSWKGMLIQYAGRLHRVRSGKEEVRVYDYVDGSVPMLAKMHEKRMKGFSALGYKSVTININIFFGDLYGCEEKLKGNQFPPVFNKIRQTVNNLTTNNHFIYITHM